MGLSSVRVSDPLLIKVVVTKRGFGGGRVCVCTGGEGWVGMCVWRGVQ